MIDASQFKTQVDGKNVDLFTISNENLTCQITNFGARTVSIIYHGVEGDIDVVQGFTSLSEYQNADEQYHGAIVGRYANRIANGAFDLNGKTYQLSQNHGIHTLHGGATGFHVKVWEVLLHTDTSLKLKLVSPHMEEGFPGLLTVELTYSIEKSELKLNYQAKSDRDTVVNLTHHPYFNLNGEGSGTAMNHLLMINAKKITEVDSKCIPSGKFLNIQKSPFDFIRERRMGERINDSHEQLKYGSGYDHNYIVDEFESGFRHLATAKGDLSELRMEVWSTEPGVQFYSANHLSGKDIGKAGKEYAKRSSFCLETQHFPDSPNHPSFPSTLLKKNHLYITKTSYRFDEE